MIKSIFFSHFHPEKGPKVVYQVPEGSIVPSTTPTAQIPLFDFSAVSDYIIPRQELCNQLVTICSNHCRIIGHPVCLVDAKKYERNEFIFNCALVLGEDASTSSYEGVVRKLAKLFKDLEEEGCLLSRPSDPSGINNLPGKDSPKIYALIEMILEDLNNFCECMIPIDESNTLNLKLFPTYSSPPLVKAWHVPLSTVRLSAFTDDDWDLTMLRILPHINGVNSVAMIAKLAEADCSLTRRAISHLLYYGCLLLLDIFQFSAIYAATPEIEFMFTDDSTQDECACYVAITDTPPRKDILLQLYADLQQGTTVKAWYLANQALFDGIDVRRFLTFGIIKGFLYRVHKYAISMKPDAAKQPFRSWARGSTHPRTSNSKDVASRSKTQTRSTVDKVTVDTRTQKPSFERYLNGLHSFDQMCTDLEVTEATISIRIKDHGYVQIIPR